MFLWAIIAPFGIIRFRYDDQLSTMVYKRSVVFTAVDGKGRKVPCCASIVVVIARYNHLCRCWHQWFWIFTAPTGFAIRRSIPISGTTNPADRRPVTNTAGREPISRPVPIPDTACSRNEYVPAGHNPISGILQLFVLYHTINYGKHRRYIKRSLVQKWTR